MSFGFLNFNLGLMNPFCLPNLTGNVFNFAQFPMQNYNFSGISLMTQDKISSAVKEISTKKDTSSSIFGFLNQPESFSIKDTVRNGTKKAKAKLSTIKTKIKGKALALKESGFISKVKGVAKRLNCSYEDLLAVMNAESGLNPHAVNKHGGATGLIQFMPKTAARLGISTEELKGMSATEQLTYVEKFLSNAKKSAGFGSEEKLSGADLYSLVFLPGRAKSHVLCREGETNSKGKLLKYYEANSRTDLNGDGKITKDELAQRIEKFKVTEITVA